MNDPSQNNEILNVPQINCNKRYAMTLWINRF